jgi:hypothetical protein
VIEGVFQTPTNPLSQLTPEQAQFLLNFVRFEGRFTRLEQELHLSYPTLRNRLNDIIRALGYEPGKEEAMPPKPDSEERRRILELLENGEIDFEEAQLRLAGKRPEPESE